jgi:hypothetical protein
MYAYIACDLFTNLETFSTLIDFQKKCYGKYTPKAVFVAGLYILSITPNFSRASYSRCSYCFLIDSSQCLLIPWKQLSPSNIRWSYWQLIEFWRFVYIMKLYGFFWKSINVEKVSKFVNKCHAIYGYIITSEELG